MDKDNPKFSRFKGAEWFDEMVGKDIIIGGCGGIGSWTALLLSRMGCSLYLFDHDNINLSNTGGQLYRMKDKDKMKTTALKSILINFSGEDIQVSEHGKYEEDSFTGDIVISCFDNMKARKTMFGNWKKQIKKLKDPLFIDGRLLAESWEIFCVTKDNIDDYKKFLFDDSEVEDAPCTFRQTSHCAAMIASHIAGFLTNHVSNTINKDNPVRHVPFYSHHIIPINYYTHDTV